MSLKRPPKPGAETVAALMGTAFAALLLVLTAMNAGSLWRDETNTINLALMPSWKDLWDNLPFESFPPLWPLILRGCSFSGITDGDAGIRVLGLCVGFLFLALLWVCSRWLGARAPILSIALLGSLPAFIFIVGANRAYGLACCLLVLSFGMIWRTVEFPSRPRILWAALVCILFTQCIYYDVVFLGAMLFGGALVTIRRRQWKTFRALVGIGVVSGASLVIYLPVIHQGSAYLPLIREPSFDPATVWYGFCNALAAWSSASPGGASGPRAWLWVIIWVELLLGGSVMAVVMQRARGRQAQSQEVAAATTVRIRTDLALFCVVSMLLGSAGCFAFLLKLQFFMQPWYYVEMLSLCAISLDGILGANWLALRPWGLLRIGFMVMVMVWGAKSAWAEAHTRRSNVDLIAAFLGQKASEGDLIVVQNAWEGITFDRYYHGLAHWMTVPPIDSHKVHRNDLVMEKMSQRDAMVPVLREMTRTLRSGKSVWLVGNVPVARPKQLPPLPPPPPPELPTQWWLGSYLYRWNLQVTELLLDHAFQEKTQKVPVPEPVSHFEDVAVVRFSGYRP